MACPGPATSRSSQRSAQGRTQVRLPLLISQPGRWSPGSLSLATNRDESRAASSGSGGPDSSVAVLATSIIRAWGSQAPGDGGGWAPKHSVPALQPASPKQTGETATGNGGGIVILTLMEPALQGLMTGKKSFPRPLTRHADGGPSSHPQVEIKGTWIQVQGAAVPILKPWSCPNSLLTTPPLTKGLGEVPVGPCPPTHASPADTTEV